MRRRREGAADAAADTERRTHHRQAGARERAGILIMAELAGLFTSGLTGLDISLHQRWRTVDLKWRYLTNTRREVDEKIQQVSHLSAWSGVMARRTSVVTIVSVGRMIVVRCVL